MNGSSAGAAAGAASAPSAGQDQDFHAFPVMTAFDALVQRPVAELLPIDPMPFGKVSVGACYSPEGAMVTIGLHNRDGDTLIGGMLAARQGRAFFDEVDDIRRRLDAGEFDRPEIAS